MKEHKADETTFSMWATASRKVLLSRNYNEDAFHLTLTNNEVATATNALCLYQKLQFQFCKKTIPSMM